MCESSLAQQNVLNLVSRLQGLLIFVLGIPSQACSSISTAFTRNSGLAAVLDDLEKMPAPIVKPMAQKPSAKVKAGPKAKPKPKPKPKSKPGPKADPEVVAVDLEEPVVIDCDSADDDHDDDDGDGTSLEHEPPVKKPVAAAKPEKGLKMTSGCVHSRAYKKARKEALDAGKTAEQAKRAGSIAGMEALRAAGLK